MKLSIPGHFLSFDISYHGIYSILRYGGETTDIPNMSPSIKGNDVTHTTAPRGLQRGHGDVVGMGQLGMSRRGDGPLVEVEYTVLSSVKHTPNIDVTANSRRESFFATSATKPLTPVETSEAHHSSNMES